MYYESPVIAERASRAAPAHIQSSYFSNSPTHADRKVSESSAFPSNRFRSATNFCWRGSLLRFNACDNSFSLLSNKPASSNDEMNYFSGSWSREFSSALIASIVLCKNLYIIGSNASEKLSSSIKNATHGSRSTSNASICFWSAIQIIYLGLEHLSNYCLKVSF